MSTSSTLDIQPGREYYWKRTGGWDWFDGERLWWEVFVVFYDGMNGVGGACIEERWRWKGSTQNMRVQPRNLTFNETVELVEQLHAAERDQ